MGPGAGGSGGTFLAGRGVARQASLRAHNLTIVLGEIVGAAEPPSRAGVAELTGLTRTTVSALVEQLIAGGLVTELPQIRSGRAGRPAAPLVAAAGTAVSVGLEVNVDYLGLRALDFAGAVLAEEVVAGDFRDSRPDEVVPRLLELYRRHVGPLSDSGMPVAAVCLAIPGLVDAGNGPLRWAPNLRWRNVALALDLTARPELAGIGVTVVNDATLAAQAEAEAQRRGNFRHSTAVSQHSTTESGQSTTESRHSTAVSQQSTTESRHSTTESRHSTSEVGVSGPPGPGVQAALPPGPMNPAISSFIYVMGEVGIGGAVVTDGRVTPGLHGWSGEIGHCTVDPAGPRCGCGSTGCLEQYAGQDALLRAAGLDLATPFAHFLQRVSDAEPNALAAVDRAGWALGIALANAVNLVDVTTVVLGGVWLPLVDTLRPALERELAARALSHPFVPVTVHGSIAFDHPALTGAALTCTAQVFADPSGWIERMRDRSALPS